MDLVNLRKLRLLFEDFPKNHHLVLIGRPNLLAALDLGVNQDIKSRVTYSVITKRLGPDAMRDFLLRELDRVGLGHNTLTSAAIDLVVLNYNGRRLLDLINRLLEFSKLEAGHAQISASPVDLNEMIKELSTSARPLAQQRQIELKVELDPDVPVIGGDIDKMDSVITNLLSNALKFTPVNGTVQLRTRRDDSRVCVYVQDSGIGIAPQDHARVFERLHACEAGRRRKVHAAGELHVGKRAVALEFVQDAQVDRVELHEMLQFE